MDDHAERNDKIILRRFQALRARWHHLLGSLSLDVSTLVDVVYHPQQALPALNYITPRRKTAMIPPHEIELGLRALRERGRIPSSHFIPTLLPFFEPGLRKLGLQPSQTQHVYAHNAHPQPLALPDAVTLRHIRAPQGLGIWAHIARNPVYDMIVGHLDPVLLGRDVPATASDAYSDVVLYHQGFPVGAARLTLDAGCAHILAVALLRDVHTPALRRLLLTGALNSADEAECDLVCLVAPEATDDLHQLGFAAVGHLMYYAEPNPPVAEVTPHDTLAQPVFII